MWRIPLALLSIGAASAHAEVVAHFVDVGQADAALIEFPDCGVVVMVDAGAQNAERVGTLVSYLRGFFGNKGAYDDTIDAIFITHNHVDHTRGLREVTEAFTVSQIYENGQRYAGANQATEDVVWAVANRSVEDVDDEDLPHAVGRIVNGIDFTGCADTSIRLLSADREDNPGWSEEAFDNKNNHSLVIRIEHGATSLLFTGDLEDDAIENLVDEYSGTGLLDVDIYQVGHHGSANGTTPDLISAMTPEIAVFSFSPHTDEEMWTAYRYGHPREDIVEDLQLAITTTRPPTQVHVARGVRDFREITLTDALYATGWDGTVNVTGTPDGRITVRTERVDDLPDCNIKGNISGNNRIYHTPESPWYARTAIDEAAGERWFCTVEEAERAGWRAPN